MVEGRVGISEVPGDGWVTGIVHTVQFEETDLVVGPKIGDNLPEFKTSEPGDLVPGWPTED